MPADTTAPTTTAWISTSSARLHYAAGGEGDAWIVMLHEIGGSLETWSRLARGLEPRFKTLCYDQRGAGYSEKIRGAFSIETQVEDLAALLAALGITGACHLAGVAIGSALAVRFAARWPQRVRSLVLASPALKAGAERKAYLHARAAKVETEGMGAVADATLAASYPPEVVREAEEFAHYRARFLDNDPLSYAAINRAFATFDATPSLAAIACPTLVIGGTQDGLRPPQEVKAVAAGIRGARLLMLDAGHIIPAQAPDEMLAAMLSFYEKLGQSN